MKIVHVLTTLELGGAQLSTLRLVKELQKNPGLKTSLIVGEDGPLLSELQSLDNVIRLPSLKRSFNPFWDLLCLFQLFSLLKKQSFQAVHTHCSKPSILGRLAALLAGIPVIFHTYHGFGHDFFRKRSRQILFRWIERALNKKSSGILFVCEENRERAQTLSIAHPENNLMIPDFLSLEKLSKRPPRKRLLPVSNPVIASILSFKEQKNPMALLALCQKIAEHYPDAQFHLIGDGPLLHQCKQEVLSKKLKNVHFPGAVLDIEPHYHSMDLFIGASRFEGLSMAQLECLYFGVPMVITRAGGISKIMEHGKQGFFYSENNLQEAFLFCNVILSGQFQHRPKDDSFFEPFESSRLSDLYAQMYARARQERKPAVIS